MMPGFTVEILPTIDSSNSELMRRFRAGADADGDNNVAADACLLVAEQQTAGRGRMGRVWQSQLGSSLTFSVGLRLNPADWSGLSLAVGVSLAESLEKAAFTSSADSPVIELKWPNDLYVNKRKLGGILIETASARGLRYVVIGVGINIRPLTLLPDAAGLMPTVDSTSLQALNPGRDAPAALLAVAAPLLRAVKAFEAQGFAPCQPRYAARDALVGQAVELSDGTQGVAQGVNLTGAMLVQTVSTLLEVTSAEVSVRPVKAPAVAGRILDVLHNQDTPSC